VVEALSNLLVVSRIEELLASVYAFFAEVMQSKGLKILKNITTWWISMLAPTVRVMNEYKVLLVKMAMDSKPAQRDGAKGQKARESGKEKFGLSVRHPDPPRPIRAASLIKVCPLTHEIFPRAGYFRV
jgi:hypothetical protein